MTFLLLPPFLSLSLPISYFFLSFSFGFVSFLHVCISTTLRYLAVDVCNGWILTSNTDYLIGNWAYISFDIAYGRGMSMQTQSSKWKCAIHVDTRAWNKQREAQESWFCRFVLFLFSSVHRSTSILFCSVSNLIYTRVSNCFVAGPVVSQFLACVPKIPLFIYSYHNYSGRGRLLFFFL